MIKLRRSDLDLPGSAPAADPYAVSAAAADFDGDGLADLVVGSDLAEENDSGQVHVVRGAPTVFGLSTGTQLWQQGRDGLLDTREIGDRSGAALATGDFNGDGVPDLAIGVPGEDNSAGAVQVIYAASQGPAPPHVSATVGAGFSVPAVVTAAPNALMTVFGDGFVEAGQQKVLESGDLVAGRIPTHLGGVCVEINGDPAPMFAAFPGQVNFKSNATINGRAEIRVVANCGADDERRSNGFSLPTVATAPEFFFFVLSQDGSNPVAAVNESSGGFVAALGTVTGVQTRAALPGEVVTVFLTGLGQTDPPLQPGELGAVAAAALADVSATLGGMPVELFYTGVTPGFAGLYQASFRIPEGKAAGRHELVLTAGGIATSTGAFLNVGP